MTSMLCLHAYGFGVLHNTGMMNRNEDEKRPYPMIVRRLSLEDLRENPLCRPFALRSLAFLLFGHNWRALLAG